MDVAGIGVGFSGIVLVGLAVGFFLANRDGNGLWVVAGLAAGLIVGGIAMGRRLWSFMRENPPNEPKLR